MSVYQANLAKVKQERKFLLEISKIAQSILLTLQNQRNNKWIKPLKDFKYFEWMTLLRENKNLKYDDLVPCIEFLSARGEEIDDVKLHDQFCNLILFLKSKSDSDPDDKYDDLNLHEQWTIYFKNAKSIECFSELLIDLRVLFLYKRNVVRVFSLIHPQWSKENNRPSVL